MLPMCPRWRDIAVVNFLPSHKPGSRVWQPTFCQAKVFLPDCGMILKPFKELWLTHVVPSGLTVAVRSFCWDRSVFQTCKLNSTQPLLVSAAVDRHTCCSWHLTQMPNCSRLRLDRFLHVPELDRILKACLPVDIISAGCGVHLYKAFEARFLSAYHVFIKVPLFIQKIAHHTLWNTILIMRKMSNRSKTIVDYLSYPFVSLSIVWRFAVLSA